MQKRRKANVISKTSFCSRRSRSDVHCREMKIGLFVTAVLFFGLAQTKAAAQSEHDVVVAADGSGDGKTVKAGIKKIPKQNWKRVVISIKPEFITNTSKSLRINAMFRCAARKR